jgi:hypothetical protein
MSLFFFFFDKVVKLRELPIKKCSLIMDFFHKGGGGSEAIQKFWGTFCAPTILEFWAEKGGGLTKSNSCWALFTLILVKYDTKSGPIVPEKKYSNK